ncbi:hypothetical protein BCR37DRAFT_376775 [Protomyces lactucae-debilis]|uniref:RING-type domain-containing protein n=1 Tax=Protomyces lactucae-debilis TaxID=2754530 RepID=A0A1Y2FQF1_PROLT|nr:uncharacterized protein BCR37DRAFT_376775 [Protomyces lactucae-debilis]ORY86223.1 hypothetical protein BCR37DRAFT_376775 [Protomyces lactucae-debilis]
MHALRREKWQGKKKHSDIIVDEDCSICQDAYKPEETLVVLDCKHAYHEECCLMWLKTNGVCPICRAPVKESNGQAANTPAPSAPASAGQESRDRIEQEAQTEMPPEPRSFLPQFILPFVNTRGQQGSPAPGLQRQDFLPEDELD